MKRETHKFRCIAFVNRWRTRRFSRNCEWLIFGAYKWWSSCYDYCYRIGFFGFDILIWFKREFHDPTRQ